MQVDDAVSVSKDRLKLFYERGMTALGTAEQKDLARQLMSETGLKHKQIAVCCVTNFLLNKPVNNSDSSLDHA